jgi:hypothetical protein
MERIPTKAIREFLGLLRLNKVKASIRVEYISEKEGDPPKWYKIFIEGPL